MNNIKIMIIGSVITLGVLFFTIMTMYRVYELNNTTRTTDTPTVKEEPKNDNIIPPKDTNQDEETEISPNNQDTKITLYLFHGKECPACNNALSLIPDDFKNINVNIVTYEVWHNPDNSKLLDKLGNKINYQISSIPFFIVGNEYRVGYSFDDLKSKINKCNNGNYKDVVKEVINENKELNVSSEKLK